MRSMVACSYNPWSVCRQCVWHSDQVDNTNEPSELKQSYLLSLSLAGQECFSVELVFINNALLHTNSIHHFNLFPFTSPPPTHVPLSVDISVHFLSAFRVFCVKKENKMREKKFSWKAEVVFCLSANCLPAVQICFYSVPKGQNKSLWWKSRTLGAEQSHESSVTMVDLGKSLVSWESLSEAQAHINTLMDNCEGLLKAKIVEICFSSSRSKFHQKGEWERVCPSFDSGSEQ